MSKILKCCIQLFIIQLCLFTTLGFIFPVNDTLSEPTNENIFIDYLTSDGIFNLLNQGTTRFIGLLPVDQSDSCKNILVSADSTFPVFVNDDHRKFIFYRSSVSNDEYVIQPKKLFELPCSHNFVGVNSTRSLASCFEGPLIDLVGYLETDKYQVFKINKIADTTNKYYIINKGLYEEKCNKFYLQNSRLLLFYTVNYTSGSDAPQLKFILSNFKEQTIAPPTPTYKIIVNDIRYFLDQMEIIPQRVETVAKKEIENESEEDSPPITYEYCLEQEVEQNWDMTDSQTQTSETNFQIETSLSIGIGTSVEAVPGLVEVSTEVNIDASFSKSFTNTNAQTKTVSNGKATVTNEQKCYIFSCSGQAKMKTTCFIVLKTSTIKIPWVGLQSKVWSDGTIETNPTQGLLQYEIGVDIFQKIQATKLRSERSNIGESQKIMENYPLSDFSFHTRIQVSTGEFLKVNDNVCDQHIFVSSSGTQNELTFQFVRVKQFSNIFAIRASNKFNTASRCGGSYLSVSTACFERQIFLSNYVSEEQLWKLEYNEDNQMYRIRSMRSEQTCDKLYLTIPLRVISENQVQVKLNERMQIFRFLNSNVKKTSQFYRLVDVDFSLISKAIIQDFTKLELVDYKDDSQSTAYSIKVDDKFYFQNVINKQGFYIIDYNVNTQYVETWNLQLSNPQQIDIFNPFKKIGVSVHMSKSSTYYLRNALLQEYGVSFTDDFDKYQPRFLSENIGNAYTEDTQVKFACPHVPGKVVVCEIEETYGLWTVDWKAKVYKEDLKGIGSESEYQGKVTYNGVSGYKLKINLEQ